MSFRRSTSSTLRPPLLLETGPVSTPISEFSRLARASVESEALPAYLLLGNDALATYRSRPGARLDTIQAWEHFTTNADIEA